jgi:hypothetical protein
MVDLDGYVLLQTRPTRVSEHRKVAEEMLGRPLLPEEVVDHIDGITIHNDPSNLRVFPTNGAHLSATLSGTPRRWSEKGRRNIGVRSDLGKAYQRVDTYNLRKKSGDVRLQQILLAMLSLGTDSHYLLGTHHYLEKAQIDYSSRSKIEHALAYLYKKWE